MESTVEETDFWCGLSRTVLHRAVCGERYKLYIHRERVVRGYLGVRLTRCMMESWRKEPCAAHSPATACASGSVGRTSSSLRGVLSFLWSR